MKQSAILFAMCVILGLLESALSRRLNNTLTLPLLAPILMSSMWSLSPVTITRLSVAAGLAKELTSGLPPGSMFLAFTLPPLLLRPVIQRPRAQVQSIVPGFVTGIIHLVTTIVLILTLGRNLVGMRPSFLSVTLYYLALPTLFAALVGSAVHFILSSPWQPRLFHYLKRGTGVIVHPVARLRK